MITLDSYRGGLVKILQLNKRFQIDTKTYAIFVLLTTLKH